MVSLYMPIVKFILALKLEFSKPQFRHLFTLEKHEKNKPAKHVYDAF